MPLNRQEGAATLGINQEAVRREKKLDQNKTYLLRQDQKNGREINLSEKHVGLKIITCTQKNTSKNLALCFAINTEGTKSA